MRLSQCRDLDNELIAKPFLNRRNKLYEKPCRLKPSTPRTSAALHVQGINTGFISSLGIDFVTDLYEAIAKSSSSFGFAVEDCDRVLGFVAFTSNLNRLYRSIIAKKGWRMALVLAAPALRSQAKRVKEGI